MLIVMWYHLERNKSEHPIPFLMWPFGASPLVGVLVVVVIVVLLVVSSAELSQPITDKRWSGKSKLGSLQR